MYLKANRQALRIALIYIGAAVLWILFSDEAVKWLFADPELRLKISILKGWGFVLTTGCLLYLAIHNSLRRWELEVRQRERAELAQREAGEKLRSSEEHLRLVMEAANDGLWNWNIVTGEDVLSPRWKEILGYQDHELPNLKSSFLGLIHPDDRALVDRITTAHLENGVRYAVEFRLRHKDGSWRWVFSRGEAVRDASGRPARMVGAITDITERKQAEALLRESEEKFSKMFRSSPMPISLSTLAEGRFLDANAEFLKLLDLKREQVIGRTALEIGVWDNLEQRQAMVEQLQRAGSIRNVELALHTATGEARYILWSAEIMVLGGQNCLLGSSLDITERKLAGQELRDSEARYRQLFELESDAVVLLDCETRRYVDVNQSAQRLYGYSREELLRMTVDQVSDDPEATRATVGSAIRHVPLRWHRRKSGEQFAVEINSNLFFDRGRKMELATLRDITTRHQIMEMLEETTEQLLEAQQIAGLGSYSLDVRAGRWSGSAVLGGIFGLPDPGRERGIAEWLQIIHPQERERMQRYLQEEVLVRRLPFDMVYRIVRVDDQQERWVHGLGKLVLDDQGQIVRMVGVIQDITQRKLAEARMNLQFSALTAAANAIVITDFRGKIEWVNPAFCRLTGYSEAEAIGANPRLLKSGQHPPGFYANLWQTVLAGDVWHGELVNRRKDGQLYTEDTTITPVRGADGKITHFVAIKQDVTAQRQLQQRIQQAQKMEAIGTLAGGIAHDFNNILASMYGYAYLLQQDTLGNAAAQDSVEEFLKATGRAKELVQQILTFSRQREQKPLVIQLDIVVKEAIKFLRASLPAQIKIELNLAANQPYVLADSTQIYQVAINLATNALHAMEGQHGLLTVSLDAFSPDQKFLQSHPDFRAQDYARLTVADTGHGMDAKTLERIFEPFFTTKPLGKGTGLGLAVVHGIVQSHGGIITVDSAVGRGTTFQLYFPSQPHGIVSTPSENHQVLPGNGQHVLLLDDEPALTGALQKLLTRMNYQVTASNSAPEVLGWFRANPAQFDVVITDLTMPELTGLEVARQIHDVRPDLPVILASGFSAELTEDRLKAAGIFELLQKPLSRNTIADSLHRALAARNGHQPH
jgi:PAS domain S-box-containing protein